MIRTLVVEDERLVAQAHAEYVQRVSGFELVGVAMSAQEAARFLRIGGVDLVLLDMFLPDGHGLDLVRRLRAVGSPIDVIAVTSARDVDVVREAISQGVVAYVIKPFAFASLRDRLEAYRTYRTGLTEVSAFDQAEVDRMISTLRPQETATSLPKGIGEETLRSVVRVLAEQSPVSAGEVGERIGASRVTARRYLEYLVDQGAATRSTRLGRTGRPEVEYAPDAL